MKSTFLGVPINTLNWARYLAYLAGSIICVAIIGWFITLPKGILMGDDLSLVYHAMHGGFLSNPLTTLWQANEDKYRPVLQLTLAFLIGIFGKSFSAYVWFNIAVELGNTFLVALIAQRLSRNLIVSFCAAIAFAFARFSYEEVFQIFGLMESLAITFTLLLIHDTAQAFAVGKPRLLNRSLIWFFLAIFTDERYIVLYAFMLTAALLYPSLEWRWIRFVRYVLIATAVVVLNIAIKWLAFHFSFLQGTAGTALAFNLQRTFIFLWDGFLNTIGFNVGPDYLSGKNITETGVAGYLFGSMTAAVVLLSVSSYVFFSRRKLTRKFWRNCGLGLALYIPLLLSASVTIREEFRWLYISFAVLIIALAAIAGQLRADRRIVSGLALCFAIATVGSAAYYRQYLSNVYFEQAFQVAREVKHLVATKHPKRLVIITNGDPSIEGWVFRKRMFFDLYGLNIVTVSYFSHYDTADAGMGSRNGTETLSVRGAAVTDLSNCRSRQTRITRFSFIGHFSEGSINSRATVSTPTGRGAFLINWPAKCQALPSLTIIASFRYMYSALKIGPNDALEFYAAKPYPIGGDTLGFIDVREARKTYRIFAHVMHPASPDGPLWVHYAIPLGQFAGRRVDIVFGADAIHDDTAAWVAFGDPIIAVAK